MWNPVQEHPSWAALKALEEKGINVTQQTFKGRNIVIAGVDEAGRGPLAGPVVAAAVVLDGANPIEGLNDSKCLSVKQRQYLAPIIRQQAQAFSVALAEPKEIDELNILEASLLAMERAIFRLDIKLDVVLIDGNQTPRFSNQSVRFTTESVISGDRTVEAISAASILAKICRDRLMQRWHRRFPDYGFDQNKGYPTPAHLKLLRALGPCCIHRKSFSPVREAYEAQISWAISFICVCILNTH